MLTLLTFADALATSDKLWNGFKDSLLWSLHDKALQLMSGGTEFTRAEEKHRELLQEEVRALLPPSIGQDELAAHFTELPPRYYQIHSASEILGDVVLAHRFMQHVSEHVLAAGEFERLLDRIAARETDPYSVADDIVGRALRK